MTTLVLARIDDDPLDTGSPHVVFERSLKVLGISDSIKTVSHPEDVGVVSFYKGYRLAVDVLSARTIACRTAGVGAQGRTGSATLET